MTVYGYCRVSVDRTESISIKTQMQLIREYVERRLPDAGELRYVVDRGVSGSVPLFSRPAGRQLRSLQRGDHLVVAKLDRAFRSVLDGAAVLSELTDAGVGVHCLDVQVDTTTPVGRAMLHMLMTFAELERERIGERLRAANRQRRRQGLPCVPTERAPLGWRVVETRDGRRFRPRPGERKKCLTLLRLRRRGMTYRELWEYCRRRRWRNRQGRLWTRARIRRAIVAAREGFPLVSEDSRRWGAESDRPRHRRRRREKIIGARHRQR